MRHQVASTIAVAARPPRLSTSDRPISTERWGGAAPEFETEDEMRTVLGTIMGRYNEIAACFGSSLNEFDPIFWEGPVGEIIASDWAGGFLGAVALRPEAWEAIIEHDRAGILIVPLLLLNQVILPFTGGPRWNADGGRVPV